MDTQPAKDSTILKLHLLVLRCQVGDMTAFRQLYQMFNGRTLGFLKSFVKGPEAEDLNQELWLTVYQRVATLTNANGFRTWLFQCARNKALDYLRSNSRLRAFREALESVMETEEIIDWDTLREFDVGGALSKGLEQLSAIHREVLVLNYLEGMDYEEIALITGCSSGTVKSRIHHAKSNLKKLMTNKNEL